MSNNWWEYQKGSSYFFWRLMKEVPKSIWDGQKKRKVGTGPRFQHPKKATRDAGVGGKDKRKFIRVRRRVYVSEGEVRRITHFLFVPKGEDISMVYNGMSSGMNNAQLDLHFSLPTVASKLIAVERGASMADRDI